MTGYQQAKFTNHDIKNLTDAELVKKASDAPAWLASHASDPRFAFYENRYNLILEEIARRKVLAEDQKLAATAKEALNPKRHPWDL